MKICEKCGESFPVKLIIEGKLRNFCTRKYCLKCSPFGSHNTQNLNNTIKQKDLNRICKICGKNYIYSRKGSHYKNLCVTCQTKFYRQRLKKRAIEYKGGKCTICGYNRCDRNMHFHHLDPKIKKFNININPSVSWEKMKEELDKCILICCLCHGEIESGLIKINENM